MIVIPDGDDQEIEFVVMDYALISRVSFLITMLFINPSLTLPRSMINVAKTILLENAKSSGVNSGNAPI